MSSLGVYRRCHYAVIAEEAAQNAFKERLNAAMEHERKHDEEMREAMEGSQDIISEAKERQEMGDVIAEEDRQSAKIKHRTSQACNFGPSFELVGSRSNAS